MATYIAAESRLRHGHNGGLGQCSLVSIGTLFSIEERSAQMCTWKWHGCVQPPLHNRKSRPRGNSYTCLDAYVEWRRGTLDSLKVVSSPLLVEVRDCLTTEYFHDRHCPRASKGHGRVDAGRPGCACSSAPCDGSACNCRV
jgi:hypothetical protein